MPGHVIYRGPSKLDGASIFVTVISGSSNRKTGDLLQTYIMRADMDPRLASKLGEDASICGDCRHRGTPTLDPARSVAEQRSCYVAIGQGPLQVWKAFHAGRYALASPSEAREIGAGRFVRLGTYGDPAAVPTSVWTALLTQAQGWTGYTHNGASSALCMVSADSLGEAQQAWQAHKRTFRIIRDVSEVQRNEVLCPASAEAGFKTTCLNCRLCNGDGSAHAKSVAIVAHGPGRNFV